MLREAAIYYAREGLDVIKQMRVREFLKHAKARLEQEIDRVRTYMHPSSEKSIKDVFLTNMIVAHSAHCIKSENQGMNGWSC
jgi:hypothetical protein